MLYKIIYLSDLLTEAQGCDFGTNKHSRTRNGIQIGSFFLNNFLHLDLSYDLIFNYMSYTIILWFDNLDDVCFFLSRHSKHSTKTTHMLINTNTCNGIIYIW